MSKLNFLIPTTTATRAPAIEKGAERVFVKEFGRKVIPRDVKVHWPQRHPITCALHHFPEGYPFRCVELGVYEGDHSYEMLTMLEPEHLYLVDVWTDVKISKNGFDYIGDSQADWDRRYRRVVDRYTSCPNVSVLRTSTEDASKVVSDDLDLVYIDACHEYEAVKNDMKCWLPKVRAGGILSGDDYYRETVGQAVADFLKDYPQYELKVSDNKTQWWFIKEN